MKIVCACMHVSVCVNIVQKNVAFVNYTSDAYSSWICLIAVWPILINPELTSLFLKVWYTGVRGLTKGLASLPLRWSISYITIQCWRTRMDLHCFGICGDTLLGVSLKWAGPWNVIFWLVFFILGFFWACFCYWICIRAVYFSFCWICLVVVVV